MIKWEQKNPTSNGVYWFYGKKTEHAPVRMSLVLVRIPQVHHVKSNSFFSYLDEMVGIWSEIEEPKINSLPDSAGMTDR